MQSFGHVHVSPERPDEARPAGRRACAGMRPLASTHAEHAAPACAPSCGVSIHVSPLLSIYAAKKSQESLQQGMEAEFEKLERMKQEQEDERARWDCDAGIAMFMSTLYN